MNIKKCDQCKSVEAPSMVSLTLQDPTGAKPRGVRAELCSAACATAWTSAHFAAPAAVPPATTAG